VSVLVAGAGFEPATFGLWVSILGRWITNFGLCLFEQPNDSRFKRACRNSIVESTIVTSLLYHKFNIYTNFDHLLNTSNRFPKRQHRKGWCIHSTMYLI